MSTEPAPENLRELARRIKPTSRKGDADLVNAAAGRIEWMERENKAWMNGVADVVEPYGFNREAACGPADLLPGLAILADRIEALERIVRTYAEMTRVHGLGLSPADADLLRSIIEDGAS